MSNLSILRNHLKLNADVITMITCAMLEARMEAKAWKGQGEIAYWVEACADARKFKVKLARAVEMQLRTKVEIQDLFRKERIVVKYTKVFGQPPQKSVATSREQEHMLDTLLAEKEAVAAEAAVSNASVA